jgi:hypothetical protein
MTDIDLATLISERGVFLRGHPRQGDDGVPFYRDFIRQYGLTVLCEIDNYESGNWVTCTCQTMLGYAGGERDRKRLQRALRRLVDAGTIERSGRSSYRLKTEQVAKV